MKINNKGNIEMKIITYLLVAAILTVGCSEILNKEPLGEVSESSAYTSDNDASQSLTSVYHVLLEFPSLFRYGIFDIASDDARKGGEGASDGAWMREFSHYTLNSENEIAGWIWEYSYLGINRANRVLENVPDIEMDQNKKDRILGEAKFLRAFFYFYLTTLYGDVPLITDSQVNTNEVERTSKNLVLELIYQDLRDASEVLPLKSQLSNQELGRATKGAAQAYLGKVFLYQGNFQNAESWFQRVIDSNEYSLDSKYARIFNIEGEFGPGNIFELNFRFDPQFPSVANAGTIRRGSAGMYGWGFSNPTQDLVDEFEPNDPRFQQTVFQDGDTLPDGKIGDVGNSETGYSSMKPYMSESETPPTGSPRDSGINEVLLRYGQLLLWYAEASNENGKTDQALNALNKVRERARQGNTNILPDVSTTDKDLLREKIWHEERVEYAMENKRWFDLVRQGRVGEVLRNYSEKYNTSKGGNFQDGIHELFPIPQSEIDLSQGNLGQNPGYN
ncbi:Starch-binding associating with outer membrane [Fodinibius roseus]|uniref:Starch-binding associating with outer membrane n=1 Tax=Fodinibius roseus TaxID=1194090 RepID=A0A1M5LZY7_9BACT|nr:RagB/SusD family nutrient uptake outer membrane protein [Fodinibius roseus]SHG70652.1 Starch-binding associating with outer membrane [Fodinibius roseus]